MDFVRVLLEDGAASGVTGTEITVFESLARVFSEEFLVRFLAGEPAGRAIYGGLTLLKSGNPLGLVCPYVMANLRVEEQRQQLEEKEAAFLDLILRAYRAEKTEGFNTFHGKKAGRLVAVGPVNLHVTHRYVEEVWTGDFIFENEWQSFRTKKDRSLELHSIFHECEPGRRKIAVKVVDIFGNNTMTIVEVRI